MECWYCGTPLEAGEALALAPDLVYVPLAQAIAEEERCRAESDVLHSFRMQYEAQTGKPTKVEPVCRECAKGNIRTRRG